MSNARHSMGASLQVNDNGDGTTFAIITGSEIIDIVGPEEMTGEVKATHLLSPNFFKERKPGLRDQGKVTLKMAFINASVTQLKGYCDARAIKLWKILYPLDLSIPEVTNAYHKGSGFLSKMTPTFADPESEDRITLDVDRMGRRRRSVIVGDRGHRIGRGGC